MEELDLSLLNDEDKKELLDFYYRLIFKCDTNKSLEHISSSSVKLKNIYIKK